MPNDDTLMELLHQLQFGGHYAGGEGIVDPRVDAINKAMQMYGQNTQVPTGFPRQAVGPKTRTTGEMRPQSDFELQGQLYDMYNANTERQQDTNKFFPPANLPASPTTEQEIESVRKQVTGDTSGDAFIGKGPSREEINRLKSDPTESKMETFRQMFGPQALQELYQEGTGQADVEQSLREAPLNERRNLSDTEFRALQEKEQQDEEEGPTYPWHSHQDDKPNSEDLQFLEDNLDDEEAFGDFVDTFGEEALPDRIKRLMSEREV